MPQDRTAEIIFIGTIRAPYKRLQDCPKTVHDNPAPCTLVLDPEYADGLFGLEDESHVLVMYWLDQARRDLLRRPGRAASAGRPARAARGVFALRTPLRPNPIAATVVPLVRVRGNDVDVTGLDCLDGTPLVDIKRAVFLDAGDTRTAV